MAQKLIDDMSDTWDPSKYHDTFRDDIMALVDRKVREGKTEEITDIEAPRESRQSADILDLSDLLKRSLGRGKSKPASGTRKRASADETADEDSDSQEDSGSTASRKKPRTTRSTRAPRSSGSGSSSGSGGGRATAKSTTTARKRRAAA
jgi:DNA end-binding protein Ku